MKVSFKHILSCFLVMISILGYYHSSGKEVSSLRELKSLTVPDDCLPSPNVDCTSPKTGNIYPGYKIKAVSVPEFPDL